MASILSAYDDLIENNTRRIKILEEMAQRIYREWFVEFRYPGYEHVRLLDSELGPLPERWTVRRLDAVCSRITDGAHKSPPSTPLGYPMASVKDMTNRGLDLASCRRIAPHDFEELVRQNCKPRAGDVLIAKDGSYLKHVFTVEEDQDVVILSSIALLRPNHLIRSSLLALYLRLGEVRERLQGYVSGVAIPRIVLKDFRVFPILIAPIEIQRALEDILSPLLQQARTLDRTNFALRTTRDLLLPRLISGEIDVENLDIDTSGLAA